MQAHGLRVVQGMALRHNHSRHSTSMLSSVTMPR